MSLLYIFLGGRVTTGSDMYIYGLVITVATLEEILTKVPAFFYFSSWATTIFSHNMKMKKMDSI